MASPALLVSVSVLATLALIGLIGLAVLVASAYTRERGARQAAERESERLRAELANLQRARGNKLYRRALDDVGFAVSQSAIRVRVLRAQLIEELDVIDRILETGKRGMES